METKIMEIAERIKGLRELMDLPVEAMAQATGTTVEEYLACENGMNDFSFTFLFKCAEIFGVDMIEILTGDRPKLSFYTIVRQGNGLPIKRRKGFTYNHLAHLFQHKLAEPFLVTAPYDEEEQQGGPAGYGQAGPQPRGTGVRLYSFRTAGGCNGRPHRTVGSGRLHLL